MAEKTINFSNWAYPYGTLVIARYVMAIRALFLGEFFYHTTNCKKNGSPTNLELLTD